MKHIITLAFLLCSFLALAQPSVSLDSTWIVNISGIFYEDRLIQFLNGESSLTHKRLGDTSQVLQIYKDGFINQSVSLATDMEWTSGFGKKITELIRQDAVMSGSLGRSPIRSIIQDNLVLADSSFKFKEGNKAAKTIKFSITAGGNLRYKLDTFPARNASLLGSVIRLNNLGNTGSSIDLYKFRDGRWRDANRTVQFYLESAGPQSANRAQKETPEQPPAPIPVIYDGGLVELSGRFYKYNASKKKWADAKHTTQKPAQL